MSHLKEILHFNQHFVENRQYLPYQSTKLPNKKLVVLSCMDTRLTELLPKAMNLKNGDAKFLKTAGAIISHPFGDTMRSLLVAIFALGAEEVYVVGHHDCGMTHIDPDSMLESMVARGTSQETLTALAHEGIDLHAWLRPIASVQGSIAESVAMIRSHPLIPPSVRVHGLIINPETGKLELLSDGS